MSNSQGDTESGDQIYYTDQFTTWCELDFGEGFLAPGGQEEVARIIEGINLTGKEVLDIGVGLAGPACLLVEKHGASHVTGIDVEIPVLKRAAKTVETHGLKDRVILKHVEPGPLPLVDECYDIVFSKDSIVHIRDTEALFRDIYRVLRPAGWVTISDWYCSDDPFTDEMLAWVEQLGLGIEMNSLETDRTRCEEAGFVDVETLDRNAWYHEICKDMVQQLRGPLYATYVEVLGEDGARDGLAEWEREVVVTSQGQLRPGHLRGHKPE